MKLAHALEIVHRSAAGGSPFSVSLACGFEALHLRTFLSAELTQLLPDTTVDVHVGLFDDLPGNIERAAASATDTIAVVVEWPDLDPRLGLRRTGGWRVAQLDGIVADAEANLGRLEKAVAAAAVGRRVACVLPTLPLPPLFPQARGQSASHELALRRMVAAAAERLAGRAGVSLASHQQLDQLSPFPMRRDVKGELTTGFPYSLEHASVVAAMLSELLSRPVPRKGLITDLDNTLWSGILDEQGPEGVTWAGEAHRHGLYQQLLGSLASAGVLLAVASRNDAALVADALGRRDLLIGRDVVYPVEVGWDPKSQSIRRILGAWNIAPDAVVFVDDDALERDEAASALPGLLTLTPPSDDDAIWGFLEEVRALFGKDSASAEDVLRVQSIRAGEAARRAHASADGPGDFLARVDGTVAFRTGNTDAQRALELINKTNQFNLNGRRLSEAALTTATQQGGELLTVSYADRYGPLGIVAALLISDGDDVLRIDTWAMSCRAFARRVEHHTLRYIFDRYSAPEVALAFGPTARNAAVRDFLAALDEADPHGPLRLSRASFDRRTPQLVHRIVRDEV